MSTFTVIFIGWIAYSVIRGYQKGLWIGLIDLLAYAMAYAAGYIWGPLLNSWLALEGIAQAGGYLIVYVSVSLAVGVLPRVLLRDRLPKGRRQAAFGAALGVALGVVSGLVGVWAYQFLLASMDNTSRMRGFPVPVSASDFYLVNQAEHLMGGFSRLAAELAGADAMTTELAVRFAAKPAETLNKMRALSESPALQAFLTSSDVKQSIQADNLPELIESQAYRTLIKEPVLAEIRELALQEVGSQADRNLSAETNPADIYLASRITHLWQVMQGVRSDPEIQRMLQDPEIQQLLERKDIPGLMANPKARALISQVLSSDALPASAAEAGH